jgi:hypothetical protein
MRALSGRSRVAAIIVPCGLQKVRRKRNRRNAGAISTQPVYVQTLVPAACACRWHPCCQPRGAASSGQPSFWAAHARTIRVYVTWRAESQVHEQVEKLNGRRHPTKQNRQNRPVRRKSAQRLSMIPKSGYRFSEKIMLQHKRCVRASFGAACFSNLQGSPELPAAGRASP